MQPRFGDSGLRQFMDTRERFYDDSDAPLPPKDAPFAAAAEHLRLLRQSDSESGDSESINGNVPE